MNQFNYVRPPLISTIMDVQFLPVDGYLPIHALNVWSLFQSDFPVVGTAEILPIHVEPEDILKQRNFQVNVSNEAIHPRYIFQPVDFTPDRGGELIQFQGNRFGHSWQCDKDGINLNYPRFEKISEKFTNELYKLDRFFTEISNVSSIQNALSKESNSGRIGKLEINNAALKYDNRIKLSELNDRMVKNWFKRIDLLEFNHESFLLNFTRKITLPMCSITRINVQIGNLLMANDEAAIGFSITVRANINTQPIESVISFFHHAHKEILNCFEEITSAEAQDYWGKKHELK